MMDDKILNEIAQEVFVQNLTFINMRSITLIKDMFSKNIIKIIQTEHTYSQYYWRNFAEKERKGHVIILKTLFAISCCFRFANEANPSQI